jgi:N-sulfoglucosamine sulfohydrolase
MNRRTFLSATSAGMLACALQAGAASRPNILWLISEDTSPDIGCYGNPLVKTPNLDRLATQGTRYASAYATCPVCSPARSAFMTGMYQTSIGAHNHRSHRDDGYRLPAPVKVITEYLREAGYFVSNGRGTQWDRGGKTDWNFNPASKPFGGTDWRERKPGQPFLAQYNFSMTHRNFKRDPQRPIDPGRVEVPPYYPDTALTRRDWADYLESLQVLDTQIGALLQRLDDDGLAENTIVVYHGDHGRPHVRGKQWCYEGGIRVPMIVRKPDGAGAGGVSENLVSLIDLAPTMMAWAGIEPPSHLQGQAFDGPAAKPRDYIVAARDRCDETVDRIRCIRKGRYKYIRNFYPERPYLQFNAYKKKQYPTVSLLEMLHAEGKLTPAQAAFMASTRPKEELYDLEADPHEVKNLAGDATQEKTLAHLRALLDAWIANTGDQGAIPEPKALTAHWNEEAQERHERMLRTRGMNLDSTPKQHVAYWEKRLMGER